VPVNVMPDLRRGLGAAETRAISVGGAV
jgi:hypothetical protein